MTCVVTESDNPSTTLGTDPVVTASYAGDELTQPSSARWPSA